MLVLELCLNANRLARSRNYHSHAYPIPGERWKFTAAIAVRVSSRSMGTEEDAPTQIADTEKCGLGGAHPLKKVIRLVAQVTARGVKRDELRI